MPYPLAAMYLCKVTGTVVATRKLSAFRTSKLLVVHPVDVQGDPKGVNDMLALDPKYGAGVGDYVLVAREGAVVQQLLEGDDGIAANVVIVGVVDDWSYDA